MTKNDQTHEHEAKTVGDLTDRDLLAVLAHRKELRRLARAERNQAISDLIHRSPDVRQFLLMLVPDHDRTSCVETSPTTNRERCALIVARQLADRVAGQAAITARVEAMKRTIKIQLQTAGIALVSESKLSSGYGDYALVLGADADHVIESIARNILQVLVLELP
jgi:hypothetical protein